jgi:ATP-binding cassette subfamily B (MDR/TAP) protein 1
LKHTAEGSNVAEEVISSIRTAHAFGTQKILSRVYDSHVKKAFHFDAMVALTWGLGMPAFFFTNYATHALGPFLPLRSRVFCV